MENPFWKVDSLNSLARICCSPACCKRPAECCAMERPCKLSSCCGGFICWKKSCPHTQTMLACTRSPGDQSHNKSAQLKHARSIEYPALPGTRGRDNCMHTNYVYWLTVAMILMCIQRAFWCQRYTLQGHLFNADVRSTCHLQLNVN